MFGNDKGIELFNQIIFKAFEMHYEQEMSDLGSRWKSNKGAKGFEVCGLYPLNPCCEAWSEAILKLGSVRSEIRRVRAEQVRSRQPLKLLQPLTHVL